LHQSSRTAETSPYCLLRQCRGSGLPEAAFLAILLKNTLERVQLLRSRPSERHPYERIVAFSDLWMDASRDVVGLCCQAFAVRVKLLLLSAGCPTFLDHVRRLSGSDTESND
jgi:hypothetical protein